jgi:hypothetical protein
MFDRTKWIAFLDRYELRGANGKGGCSEVTDGFIVHAAVFGDNQCDPGTYKATKMALLRVGKVRPGKCPPSNTAINSGDEPPRVTHAMQAVKMKFIEATIRLLVVDEAKHEDVFAVEWWVLMSQNTVTVNTSNTKRKYDEDGLPNETPTTPFTPSMKTTIHHSTTITPTFNIIPSPPECHPLSQEFPILSSFNPGLLQPVV